MPVPLSLFLSLAPFLQYRLNHSFGGFQWGTPKAGWFLTENRIYKCYPHFRKPPFILIHSCAINSFGQHCLPKSIVHLLPDLSIVQPLTKQCPEPNKGPQLPKWFQWIGSSYSKGYHLKKTMRLLNQLCDGWKAMKQE